MLLHVLCLTRIIIQNLCIAVVYKNKASQINNSGNTLNGHSQKQTRVDRVSGTERIEVNAKTTSERSRHTLYNGPKVSVALSLKQPKTANTAKNTKRARKKAPL